MADLKFEISEANINHRGHSAAEPQPKTKDDAEAESARQKEKGKRQK